MTKYRIIDNYTRTLHEGEYNCVHTSAQGREEGPQILWVTHNLDETVIAVQNATTLAVDGDTLWIGTGPYLTKDAKVVWKKAVEQPLE